MKVVIIGAGNVATVLGRKLLAANHQIIQVFARIPEMANALATELKATACNNWSGIDKKADFYLVAISDNALEEISDHLELNEQLIAHTAGAVSKEVLRGISDNYGVFYPLQSLRKEMKVDPEIPIVVDASNKKSLQLLKEIAGSISSQVDESKDEQRLQLHLAAVFVSNFVNHMYVQSEKYCQSHQLDFKKLLPLIKETAGRVQNYSPASVQTGPAIRFDSITIEKHLQLLNADPSLKRLYELLTKSIQQVG
jgi:predicted short-subunit dehydrogenase-like oxidoreductase (DUF2520 family)